ncbi:hypothetical protein [Nocardia jinanensis]|uniref:Uncharacterized protein n=1 Tax=Nocardia jinanensis TaxID=382504 RepID=A0A917VZW1_9NOCA|nr:hypothetical protein [Nocardia jinanensis]GGL45011.1 hypothetical protein GCM10011588_69570 [Nocardia jinanensis]
MSCRADQAGDQGPEAEEIALRLYLRPAGPGDTETDVRLTVGTAFVVPRSRRHRLELEQPSDIMSIGLRHGTRIGPVTVP